MEKPEHRQSQGGALPDPGREEIATLHGATPGKSGAPTSLSRRDKVLLPLVGLLTVVLLAGSTELIARVVFRGSASLLANCIVLNDPKTGPRGVPNSVCTDKSPESRTVEYRFDMCGYRSSLPCGPKPPGTFRIVLIGSSGVLGQHVRAEDTFASLLPMELSRRAQRKVEVYNAGMGWGFPPTIGLRFDQVLAEHPDLILWVLNPGDVEGAAVVTQVTEAEKQELSQSLPGRTWMYMKRTFGSEPFAKAVQTLFDRTRTAVALRHFLYLSQSQHVKATLDYGYLQAALSPEWEDHLRQFDVDFATVSERAKAAGVPLAASYTPSSTQAAMISMGDWPAGTDPYKVDEELRKIVDRHHDIYLEILPQYRGIPNPDEGFFPVDGHANAAGHAIFAELLSKELTSGAVPGLKAATPAQIALRRER